MEFELEELPEQPVLGVRFTTSMDRIAADIGDGFARVFGYMGPKMLAPAGPPFALYFDPEMDESNIDMEICAPVACEVEGEGDVIYHVLPAGRFATTLHTGPYDTMVPTYEAMMKWMSEKGLEPSGPVREVYLNDPAQVEDPSRIMTRIIWPVK